MQQEESVNNQKPVSQTNGASAEAEPSAAAPMDEGAEANALLAAEVTELKDKYVRVFAEMENMRRRQERERGDLLKYALETVFKDLLPVLDSLDKAIPDQAEGAAAAKEGAGGYYEGMQMVKRQLLDVCKKHGLEPITSLGVPFDPNVHQGIQRIESADVEVETVADEYARGYNLNGRLIRPAMVSVLTPVGN